ncbi:unnamed protein product, partial [Choristocarpus tenellus]
NPRRIYVGSLHYELKESDISAIFSAFGPLKTVDMSHDPATFRHKGFCFIEYLDIKSADAALAAMNGFELAGRAIKVGRPHGSSSGGFQGNSVPAAGASTAMQLPGMAAFMAQRSGTSTSTLGTTAPTGIALASAQLKAAMASNAAPPQTKIYVGNVEQHITTEMIRTIFQPFGNVVGAEMVVDPSNPGEHRGYGFIQYASETVAKVALETMNGFELAGRNLRVAWAQDQSKPAQAVLPPGVTAAAVAAAAVAAAGASGVGTGLPAGIAGGTPTMAQRQGMAALQQLQAALGGSEGAGNVGGVSFGKNSLGGGVNG